MHGKLRNACGSTGRRLKNDRGETMIEVLAAVLIVALSVALLFGAVMASGSMDRSAQTTDVDLYAGLNAAQTHTGATVASGEVTISGGDSGIASTVKVSVNFYGGGGVVSYIPAP